MNKGKEFREVGIKKGGERVLNIFQAKVFKKLQIHPHKLLLIAENSEKKVNSTQPEWQRFIRFIQPITVYIKMYSKESFSAKKYNLKKWMSS